MAYNIQINATPTLIAQNLRLFPLGAPSGFDQHDTTPLCSGHLTLAPPHLVATSEEDVAQINCQRRAVVPARWPNHFDPKLKISFQTPKGSDGFLFGKVAPIDFLASG